MGDDIFFLIALLWVAFIIGLSVVYRKNVGKPIFPRIPDNALFAEKRASANFAGNCLLLSVTDQKVWLVPQFPFTLMFLPEIYRLEKEVPVSQISSVDASNSWFGNNLIVSYEDDGPRNLRVRLREPFVAKNVIERAKQALRS